MLSFLTRSYPLGAPISISIRPSVRTQVRNLEKLNGFLWNFCMLNVRKTVDNLNSLSYRTFNVQLRRKKAYLHVRKYVALNSQNIYRKVKYLEHKL